MEQYNFTCYDAWCEGLLTDFTDFELSIFQAYEKASESEAEVLKRAFPELFFEVKTFKRIDILKVFQDAISKVKLFKLKLL